MITRSEFREIAKGLRLAYWKDGFFETAEQLEFWYAQLRLLNTHVVREVVEDYIKREKFPPALSDIYAPCEERESAYKREVWDIYEFIKGAYPNGTRSLVGQGIWVSILNTKDRWEDRVKLANKIQKDAMRFLRKRAGKIDEPLPPFDRYMQGVLDEL